MISQSKEMRIRLLLGIGLVVVLASVYVRALAVASVYGTFSGMVRPWQDVGYGPAAVQPIGCFFGLRGPGSSRRPAASSSGGACPGFAATFGVGPFHRLADNEL